MPIAHLTSAKQTSLGHHKFQNPQPSLKRTPKHRHSRRAEYLQEDTIPPPPPALQDKLMNITAEPLWGRGLGINEKLRKKHQFTACCVNVIPKS